MMSCLDDGSRFFNALGLFFSDLHLPGQFLSGATHARSGADAEILQQSSLLGKLPPCCSQLIPHPSQASFESAAFYTEQIGGLSETAHFRAAVDRKSTRLNSSH